MNPMIHIGKLGGWNHMHLVSRVLMRSMMVLLCWALLHKMMSKNEKKVANAQRLLMKLHKI